MGRSAVALVPGATMIIEARRRTEPAWHQRTGAGWGEMS